MTDNRRTLAGLTLSTYTTKSLGTSRLVPVPVDRVAYQENIQASAPHSHFRMTQPVSDISLRYTFIFRTTREGSRVEVPLDIGILVNDELVAVERGQEPIWVNGVTSGLTGTIGVSREFVLGDKVQPVLINRGIGCDIEISSVSLDLYDGRVNVTYSVYNNYTDIVNIIGENLIAPGTGVGQMTYWDGNIWAHTEVENLVWDPETSRMGLGVPVPAFALDVAGTGQFTGLRTGAIQFDVSASGISHNEGLLHWGDDSGTLELGMPGNLVHHRIGQEILCRGKNAAGVIIPKGSVVRVNGADGANPTLTLANATNHIYAMGTIAVAAEEIAVGQFGYITAMGRITAMDTSMAFADGAPLFLSTTDGVLSRTLPTQPLSQVFIGIALRKHATEGVLLVKIIPQPNIGELSNMLITTVADRDVLTYDTETTTWQNKSIISFNDIYVPYTGATANVDLGTHTLDTKRLLQSTNGNNLFLGTDTGIGITTGDYNIFMGTFSGKLAEGTINSIGIGYGTLSHITNGTTNIALGNSVMQDMTSGSSNTSVGAASLAALIAGGGNTVLGTNALYTLKGGDDNVAIGYQAGWLNSDVDDFEYGSRNIYIGAYSMGGTGTVLNEIVVGYQAVGAGSNTVTIGNSSITHNYFTGTVAGADAVLDTEYVTKSQLTAATGDSYWDRTGTTLIPSTSTDTVQMDGLSLIDNVGTGYTTVSSIGKYGDVSWASDTQLITAKTIDTRITATTDSIWWDRDNADNFLYTKIANDKVIIGGTTIPEEALEITGNLAFTQNSHREIYVGQRTTAGVSNNLTLRGGAANPGIASGGHLFLTGGLGGATSGTPIGGNVYVYGRSGDGYGAVILGWDGAAATKSHVGIGRTPNITLDVNGHFGLEDSASTTVNKITNSTTALSASSTDSELATAKAIWAAVGSGSNPLTTKGDLFTYSTVGDRLPIGADGYILSADSTETTGLKWVEASSGGTSHWARTGSVLSTAIVNDQVVIGGTTVDAAPLTVYGRIDIMGTGGSIFIGKDAGLADDWTDNYNVFIGDQSGLVTTSGGYNVGVGARTLTTNSTGSQNFALGYFSLYANTTGDYNVGMGNQGLGANTTGARNVAIGYNAVRYNQTGSDNIGIGYSVLRGNTGTAISGNVVIGNYAASLNVANFNTALGHKTINVNTTGHDIVAIGYQALEKNTTGNYNVGIGSRALDSVTTAGNNVGIGYGALGGNVSGYSNVAIGHQARTSGSSLMAIAIGYQAGYLATGDKNISIGVYAAWAMDGAADSNISIGESAGRYVDGDKNISIGNNTNNASAAHAGSYNIIIGENIDAGAGADYKLNIGNIIKGEIDNGIVSIHDILAITPRAAAPTSPVKGWIYANSTDNHIYYYNGTVWKQLDNA